MRTKLEEERRALAAFVSKFDALGLGGGSNLASKLKPPKPVIRGATTAFTERQQSRVANLVSISSIKEESTREREYPTVRPGSL